MKKNILVPLDNSPVSQDVISLADQWAQQMEAKLYFLHARDSKIQKMVDDGVLIEPKEVFEHYLESANCRSPYEVMHRSGRAYQAILDAEVELEPELIIMTAHDHTMLGRAFLGSNTDHVLHDGKYSMFVYKQPKKELVQSRAVVPIDYTPVSEKLVRVADEWARQNQVELFFLHVHEMPEIQNVSAVGGGYYTAGYDYEGKMHDNSSRVEEFENHLRDLVRMQAMQSPYQIRIDFGKPYLKILELCRELQAGTLLMAAHSHTLAGRLLIGSNTDHLLHNGQCSMYIFKDYELDE